MFDFSKTVGATHSQTKERKTMPSSENKVSRRRNSQLGGELWANEAVERDPEIFEYKRVMVAV